MFMCSNSSDLLRSNRSASGVLTVSHMLRPFGEYLALIIVRASGKCQRVSVCRVSYLLSKTRFQLEQTQQRALQCFKQASWESDIQYV